MDRQHWLQQYHDRAVLQHLQAFPTLHQFRKLVRFLLSDPYRCPFHHPRHSSVTLHHRIDLRSRQSCHYHRDQHRRHHRYH